MSGSQNFGASVFGRSGLTATGLIQADAFSISIQETVFTTVPVGSGCRLPGPVGAGLSIFNQGAHTLKVYPGAGDRIGGNDVNAPLLIPAGTSATFSSFDSALTPQPRTWNYANPGAVAPVNTQNGTSYTLQSSDNGKIIDFTNANPVVLTVGPKTEGFSCVLSQSGAGAVTPTGSGVTVSNRQSHTATAGQFALASLVFTTTTTVIFAGDTA